MALDEALAARVRNATKGTSGLVEKKMFGGLAFLLRGNMSVGVHGGDLIVRVAPGDAEKWLAQPGVRVFDLTGRPMKGWIVVSGDHLLEVSKLKAWVERGLTFAGSLPPK